MAISVIPPTTLTPGEHNDIAVLSSIIIMLATILDNESAILDADRQMTDSAISSLNTTLTDASDRIDATINPPIPLS